MSANNNRRLEELEKMWRGGADEPTTPSPETVELLDHAARIKSAGGDLESIPQLREALRAARERRGVREE